MGKKEVGVYLVNKKKFDEALSNQEIAEKIKDEIGTEYQEIKIREDVIDGYRIELYNRISTSQDTWSSFWNVEETDNDEEKIVKGKRANNYIAVIYGDNNIFCVTTNTAYNNINKFIVYFYGVGVMSHFIKDEDKIRSATYSNIMSNFLGGTEYLGEEYHTTLDKYWNRVNTGLMAEVDRKRLYEELGIENKRKNDNVRCDARDRFTICSKISLKELITIIKKLDEISDDELIDKFNTIERVKDEDLEEILKTELVRKVYDDYRENRIDLCLVHKDMEKFFQSMSFGFMYRDDALYTCDTIPGNKDLRDVFDSIEINSLEDMKSVIEELQLICYDSSNQVELSDHFNCYINVSIEHDGVEYLYQHKTWYKLTDSYIDNLDNVFKFIKRDFSENELKFKKWNNKSEGQYIELYDGEENYYKIHPRLEDGIEVCDLMYIDKENQKVKLLYLKDGFGANTRDLSIQVTMGLKRLLAIIRDDKRTRAFYNKYIKDKTPEYEYKDFKRDVKEFSKDAVMVYKLPKGNKESSNIGKQSVIFAKNEVETLGRCKFLIKQL